MRALRCKRNPLLSSMDSLKTKNGLWNASDGVQTLQNHSEHSNLANKASKFQCSTTVFVNILEFISQLELPIFYMDKFFTNTRVAIIIAQRRLHKLKV